MFEAVLSLQVAIVTTPSIQYGINCKLNIVLTMKNKNLKYLKIFLQQ
jgi:hypothetical protein